MKTEKKGRKRKKKRKEINGNIQIKEIINSSQVNDKIIVAGWYGIHRYHT